MAAVAQREGWCGELPPSWGFSDVSDRQTGSKQERREGSPPRTGRSRGCAHRRPSAPAPGGDARPPPSLRRCGGAHRPEVPAAVPKRSRRRRTGGSASGAPVDCQRSIRTPRPQFANAEARRPRERCGRSRDSARGSADPGRPRPGADSGAGTGSGNCRYTPPLSNVTVYYPFHPLHGLPLAGADAPWRRAGRVTVLAPAGYRVKLPLWMPSPQAACCLVSPTAEVGVRARLRLADLLGPRLDQGGEDGGAGLPVSSPTPRASASSPRGERGLATSAGRRWRSSTSGALPPAGPRPGKTSSG